MYFKLRQLKTKIEDEVCKGMEIKRIEFDDFGNQVYTTVEPLVFLFDETVAYRESKMPYICISAKSLSFTDRTDIHVDLKIMVKNDGLITKKFDDEGNQLVDTNFKPNDFMSYESALAIAEKCRMVLLSTNNLGIVSDSQGLRMSLEFDDTDYTGDGIACAVLKFIVRTKPFTFVNKNYLDI